MFRRAFLQLPMKAEKLHKEHNGSEQTLFTGNVKRVPFQRDNKVINNDIELLINKFCGKTWKEYTLFLIRCRCTYSYSV